MERNPATENPDQAAAVEMMARTAAGMTSASMLGLSFMTQAVGLWMGSVARTLEGFQRREAAESEPSRAEVRVQAETRAAPPEAKPASATVTELQPHRRKTQAAAGRSAARAAKPDKSGRPDDLKRIPGIGPKLEQLLNEAGFATYAQVAAMTKKEAKALDERLGLQGRIARDGWIAKASDLGGK